MTWFIRSDTTVSIPILLLTSLLVTSGTAARAQSTPDPLPPAALNESTELRLVAPRYEGSAVGGGTVRLIAGGSKTGTTIYRWKQVDGPAVQLSRSTGSEVEFVVPNTTGKLRFLLVGSNSLGADAAEIIVPIEPRSRDRETARTSVNPSDLVADAGDDQIAIAGRQVTLNGNRSEPQSRIGFRWLQVGGPPVQLALEDRNFYSFVPNVPGEYRFALVVAASDEISKPDYVTVTVGGSRAAVASAVNPAAAARMATPEPPPADAAAAPAAPVSIADVARTGLLAVKGKDRGEKLAQTFEDAADRMDLYGSYAEAYNEISRRLDVILPADLVQRRAWVEAVFNPLTERLVEAARTEGLELRTTEGQAAPLTPGQRAKLAEQFRLMSEGFRGSPAVASPSR